VKNFTEAEEGIIRNMMLTTSYKDIASLLDCSKLDVAEIVDRLTRGTDIITWQAKLNQKKAEQMKAAGPKKMTPAVKARIEKEKDKQLKKQVTAQRNNFERNKANTRREFQYKTKHVDFTKMVSVRVDEKTQILVPAGTDPEATKAKYLKNNKNKIIII